MGAPVTLKNVQDSYVNSDKPAKNYNRVAKMFLQNGAFGFMFWAQPFPLGATIISAKVRVWNGDDWAGTRTMKIARAAAKWTASKIKWNNMPGVTGANTSISKTDADAGTMWELDFTPQMQQVADGAPWYGIRIDIDGATRHWIHSAQSPKSGKRPQMIIAWAELPDTPSDLSPDHGTVVSSNKVVLRFDFHDVFGDTNMGGYQVQISTDETFVTTNYDSGWVDSEIPQHDMNDFAYALPANTDLFWRVRVKDETNVQSLWSDGAEFSYQAPGVITLNGPTVANPYVEDPTPPFLWAFSLTQKAYRFMLTDPDTLDVIFDSGKVTSTDTSLTPPAGILKEFGKTYHWILQIWDDLDRATTPDHPSYVQADLDFVLQKVAAVTPPATLDVSNNPGLPAADLTWTRATPPDSFTLIRDGQVYISDIDPDDVFVAGTTYRLTDFKVRSRRSHTWEIAAVVNHQISETNPVVTETFSIVGPWLVEPDGDNAIMLLEAQVDVGMGDDSQVVYTQGNPYVVIQSQWDGVGTASGLLTDHNLAGLTASQLRDRFLAMRAKKGQELVFKWSDRAENVVIYDVTCVEQNVTEGHTVDYLVSFGFVVVD